MILYFYIIPYNFMNCQFLEVNFALSSINRVNIIKETLLPYVCFPFLWWVKFCCDGFSFFLFFFSFGKQKKWLLVMLDRWLSYTVTTVCMRICLGRLSIGHLRWVAIWTSLTVYGSFVWENICHVWEIEDKRSSKYRLKFVTKLKTIQEIKFSHGA